MSRAFHIGYVVTVVLYSILLLHAHCAMGARAIENATSDSIDLNLKDDRPEAEAASEDISYSYNSRKLLVYQQNMQQSWRQAFNFPPPLAERTKRSPQIQQPTVKKSPIKLSNPQHSSPTKPQRSSPTKPQQSPTTSRIHGTDNAQKQSKGGRSPTVTGEEENEGQTFVKKATKAWRPKRTRRPTDSPTPAPTVSTTSPAPTLSPTTSSPAPTVSSAPLSAAKTHAPSFSFAPTITGLPTLHPTS